jgi:multidrug efflux pump subunit AcrB
MRSLIRWGLDNAAAMNVLVAAVILFGAFCFMKMRRETFPEFELEVVMVQVMYPGATPDDVESGICQKIEEAVRAIDGIKKVTSIAREGGGYVLIELRNDVRDIQKVVNEIDREVQRIPSFPDLAEDPEVQQIVFRDAAIRVAVLGPKSNQANAELQLRAVVERVRDELLDLETVSTAEIMGAKPYQIDVEISEEALRQHGLSLQQVAAILRTENIELPGGQLKSEGQEFLLRAQNKGRIGDEIRALPLITQPGGTVLTVGDLGSVRDEFEDIPSISEVNGRQAMVVSVERTKQEDLLAMTDQVKEYVATATLPPGYSFQIFGDTSVDVRDRLNLLVVNGLQGLALVFLLLAIFLEMRLAFWVAMGIPISILGAGIVLTQADQTLNMISMFALLMTLGIVVDDAIVIGENIYVHRQMGKSLHQAALDGTAEVMGSVIGAVMTTIIAFMPLFFVSGVMGKFIAVMPLAIISTLVISLLEGAFVLPCHLAHERNLFLRLLEILLYPLRPFGILLKYINRLASAGIEWFSTRIYQPSLHYFLERPLVAIAIAIGLLVVTAGMFRSGIVPLNTFPKTDTNLLIATVRFPDGSPLQFADAATKQIEKALWKVSREIGEEHAQQAGIPAEQIYSQSPIGETGPVKLSFRQVGSTTSIDGVSGTAGASGAHVGQMLVELYDSNVRTAHSEEIITRWRNAVGEIPGIDTLVFSSADVGPGGRPIEFKLLAPSEHTEELKLAVEAVKERMASKYSGLFDIRDDNTPGKWEFQFKVKDRALATGVTPTTLGETVRNAYYGAEVMRLQRGRHEVKLMVRYPPEQRRSLADFQEIRIQGVDGVERPITELAEIDIRRGFSEINRVDQMRSITVTSDVDEQRANAQLVVQDLRTKELPGLLEAYPNVRVRWEGQQAETQDSVNSLLIGFVVAMIAMFVLLVLQFQSYLQPFLIMAIIPFGLVGAVWGHAALGLELTLFSMFGLVALTGVVVNDSIVLIDFINTEVRNGMPIRDALVQSGVRRLRPIMLTSVTTIAGLLPLMLERSFQAKLLIPMAVSLSCGLMASTVLCLYLVPVFYQAYLGIVQRLERWFGVAEAPSSAPETPAVANPFA